MDWQQKREPAKRRKLSNHVYESELARLQVELVKMKESIQFKGLRVVVVSKGRDSAGKGAAIKRITEKLSPRVCRVVALPAPTQRQ